MWYDSIVNHGHVTAGTEKHASCCLSLLCPLSLVLPPAVESRDSDKGTQYTVLCVLVTVKAMIKAVAARRVFLLLRLALQRFWAQMEGTSGRVPCALDQVGLGPYAKELSSVLSLGQVRETAMLQCQLSYELNFNRRRGA